MTLSKRTVGMGIKMDGGFSTGWEYLGLGLGDGQERLLDVGVWLLLLRETAAREGRELLIWCVDDDLKMCSY